jgi:hypothetical protein
MVCSSVNARQSSVNPRHKLSALRFAWRSDRPVPFTVVTVGESVGVEVEASILVKVNASAAAASSALYTSEPTAGLALAKADCNRVCMELAVGAADVVSSVTLVLRICLCFGDEDSVVAVVVAVRGRSPETLDIAAADDPGNLPVNSSFLIRDLRSSSSSQTVDGAVVDKVDSVVPSCRVLSPSDVDACRTVRDDKFDRFEYLKRASAMEVFKSGCGSCGDSGDKSRL